MGERTQIWDNTLAWLVPVSWLQCLEENQAWAAGVFWGANAKVYLRLFSPTFSDLAATCRVLMRKGGTQLGPGRWAEHHGGHRWLQWAGSRPSPNPLAVQWLQKSRQWLVGSPAYRGEDDRVMCQRLPSRLVSELAIKQPCFQSLAGSMNKYPHESHRRDRGL